MERLDQSSDAESFPGGRETALGDLRLSRIKRMEQTGFGRMVVERRRVALAQPPWRPPALCTRFLSNLVERSLTFTPLAASPLTTCQPLTSCLGTSGQRARLPLSHDYIKSLIPFFLHVIIHHSQLSTSLAKTSQQAMMILILTYLLVVPSHLAWI